ncbi:MAG: hypothetical protein FWF96_01405, partial [Kiritimatiellaeota bacterium]|nr:hypothetical protein [Kiritimatiellota bacterium]
NAPGGEEKNAPKADVAKAAAEGCLEDIREMDDDVMKADLLDMVMLNPDRLDEDTFNEALSLFDDLPERLAAEKLIEILKKTNNPEYASEEIDALQFILQADPPLDNENKAESLARAEVLFKELPPDEPKESDE